MAFLQYFFTAIPGFSVSCKVQCLRVDHLCSKSSFHVLQKVWSAVSYSLKVSRRHCRGQEGLAGTVGVSAAAPWECPWFSLWEKQDWSCCGHTFNSSTANCSSLKSPPQGGILGGPKGRVRSVVPLLGQVVTTKLCVTCRRQLRKGKREFFCFFGQGRGGKWLKTGYQVYWGRVTEEHKVPGSALPSSPRATLVPNCPIPALGMSQLSQPLFWFGDFLRGLWDLGTPQFLWDLGTLAALKSSPGGKKKKAECVGLKFGKSPSSLSRLSPWNNNENK